MVILRREMVIKNVEHLGPTREKKDIMGRQSSSLWWIYHSQNVGLNRHGDTRNHRGIRNGYRDYSGDIMDL